VRRIAALLLLALAARGEDSLGVRVNRALDAAAAHLVSRQAADGSWQADDVVHPLGRTALCSYALLHAGCARDHPALVRALAWLHLDDPRHTNALAPRSTYETGCLLLLLHALGPDYDATIKRLCQWLVERFDDGRKLWGYPDGTPDLSNTQFAVFGLKAGEMHGFKVPRDLWRDLLRSVPRLQARDGAFRYTTDDLYRASMTHAALIVLRFALEGTGARRPPADLRRAMARAQKWYEEHYDVEATPWGRGHHSGYYYYYLYGLSRYAQIFDLARIGDHDWYAEGAEALLRKQKEDGSWGSLEDTCFAILFLRKVVFTPPTVREQGPVWQPPPPAAAPPRPGADVPCLKTWLVAGPFRGERGEDDALFDPPLDVRRASPADGRDAGKLEWKAFASPDDKVDLSRACPGDRDWACFLAACWLHVPAPSPAVLWIASDDGCRVWLDGEEVLFGHHHDYSGDDFYRVPVDLSAGRHVLLVAVENLRYDAFLRVRLSDPDGKPLPGVTATLRRRP